MSHRWHTTTGFGDVYGLGNHGTMRVSAPCLVPIDSPRHHLSVTETQRSRVVDQVIGAFLPCPARPVLDARRLRRAVFMYFEDVALRARQSGAKTYFLKQARGLSTRATSAPTIPRGSASTTPSAAGFDSRVATTRPGERPSSSC